MFSKPIKRYLALILIISFVSTVGALILFTRPTYMVADHWKNVSIDTSKELIVTIPTNPEKYLSEEELNVYKSYGRDPIKQQEVMIAFLEQKLATMVKFNFELIDENKKLKKQ